jgi:hypothetical protein
MAIFHDPSWRFTTIVKSSSNRCELFESTVAGVKLKVVELSQTLELGQIHWLRLRRPDSPNKTASTPSVTFNGRREPSWLDITAEKIQAYNVWVFRGAVSGRQLAL